MNRRRLAFRLLLVVHLLSMVAISVALVRAYQLGGEWSAVVMIVDGVVLVCAVLIALVGGALLKRDRGGVVWLALWSALGPLPVALYSVLHCIKMFG